MKSDVIREFLVQLGFKIDGGGMAQFLSGVSKATVAVTAMGTAATAASAAIFAGVKNVATDYYELDKLATQLNSSADALDDFLDSAEVFGVNSETAVSSIKNLNSAIIDTSMGIGRTKLVFEDLGISVVDAAGKIRPTTDVLLELNDAFKTMDRGKQLRVMERLGIDSSFLEYFLGDLRQMSAEFSEIDRAVGFNFKKTMNQGILFQKAILRLRHETQKWKIFFATVVDVIATKMMPRMRNSINNTALSFVRFRHVAMDVAPMVISKIIPLINLILRVSEAFVSLSTRLASAAAKIIIFILKINAATNGWAGYLLAAAAAWKYLNLAFLSTPLGRLLSLATVVALLIDDFLTFKEGGESLINWGTNFGFTMQVITTALTLFLAKIIALKAWAVVVTVATNAWAAATGILNGVLAAARVAILATNAAIAANPIGAAIIAITALVTAGYLLIKNWDAVKRWFSSFFDFIIRGFEKASNIAGKIAGVLGLGGIKPTMLTPSPQTQATMTARAQSVNQRTQIVVNGNADPASTARAIAGQQTRVNADMARNMRAVAR